MNAQDQIRQLIQTELARIRAKNPGYSMRAMARRIQVSQPALSGILSGKLPITQKTGLRILQNLGVPAESIRRMAAGLLNRHVSGAASSTHPGSPDQESRLPNALVLKAQRFELLRMDEFELISQWYYFAILSLAETKGFCDDPKWIAHRLKMRVRDVRTALVRLERQGLLASTTDGRLRTTGKNFRTSSDVPNPFVRHQHIQGLEIARTAMEGSTPFDLSDFSAMTMAISPQKIPDAKRMIRKFRRQICEFLESEEKTEVYRLSIQLFPLSQKVRGENDVEIQETNGAPKASQETIV